MLPLPVFAPCHAKCVKDLLRFAISPLPVLLPPHEKKVRDLLRFAISPLPVFEPPHEKYVKDLLRFAVLKVHAAEFAGLVRSDIASNALDGDLTTA